MCRMTGMTSVKMKIDEFSHRFTVVKLEDFDFIRFISSMNFTFIKILDIRIELLEITRRETVQIACRNVDVLQTVSSAYEL